MFLRNYWYVAADGREVQGRPLRRIILGEPGPTHRRGGISADGPRPAVSWSPELPPAVDGLAKFLKRLNLL